jgi:hypothetical protein
MRRVAQPLQREQGALDPARAGAPLCISLAIVTMARQNTQLESAGAEFLVLGHLLIEGIPAFKSYTNMKGYDLIAANADENLSIRVQVKSRWRTNAEGFIINNFDCDFVVVALLNRGSKSVKAEVRPPEFFIFPVEVARALPRTGWGKVSFSKFPNLQSYRQRWDLIRSALKMTVEG